MLLPLVFCLSLLANFGSSTAEKHLIELKKCITFQNIPAVFRNSNSTVYNQLNKPFQLKPPLTEPLAFIFPRNERDVMSTVDCCRSLGIRLVPKSGGHSYEKYSFGNRNSVVVDLRALDELRINDGSVVVGPGNLVAPLNYKLWKAAKLIIPVTNAPTIGIATGLGGGLGAFAGTFGIALDHILEMRVVLVSGVVVVANENQNPDLFWALRGAGAQSFGIVTQFLFRALPAPPIVFEALLTYPIDRLAEVMNIWQYILAPEYEPSSVTTKLFSSANGTFTFRYTDTSGNAHNFQKLLPRLPEPTAISQIPRAYPDYITLWAKLPEFINPDVKLNSPEDLLNLDRSSQPSIYIKSKSFFVQKLVGLPELTQFQTLFERMPSSVIFFFESIGGSVRSTGIRDTAFVHRGFTLFNAIAYYLTPFPNTTANAIGTSFVEEFWHVGKIVFDHTETYQNDVEGDLRNYLRRYYGTNLERLIQVKREYDPANFFHYPQSIPTSLPCEYD